MCDIQIRAGTIGEQCFNGNRFVCSEASRCPNATKLPGEASATMARLCDMHAVFCRHCARPYCRSCIVAHQDNCAMRPTPETTWERVQRVHAGGQTT